LRDQELQHVFEIADDSFQGIIGYFMYVGALQSSAEPNKILQKLPDNQFPMTFSWVRFYGKQDLLEAFKEPYLQLYQARISLTSMVTVLDVALNGFVTNLEAKGHKQKLLNRNLKTCLKWAHEQLASCGIGDQEAIKRLPNTLGIIDNARRLRNLITHNQGLFDDRYSKDILDLEGIVIDTHPHYGLYKANPERAMPVVLDNNYFFRFSMAHIEVLHLLHNHLQSKYFNHKEPYDYRIENKLIEWNKALWGKANVVLETTESSNLKGKDVLFYFKK
jgi:hypothetical protein